MLALKAPGARALILVSLVLLAIGSAFTAAQGQKPAAADARVGIVLGNAPAGTDEPTAMQTARCLKAFELYKNGTVKTLLVTGGFTRDYISEARMMKIALVTYGVAPDDVLEEELAATTIENGLFAARMFDARRLRIAAALYHRKIAPTVVLYNDRYTRGPVNLATMMKIGLISLGVPAASIKAVARGEHRRLVDVAKAYTDTSAIVLTTAVGGEHLAPETAPKWKVVFVE